MGSLSPQFSTPSASRTSYTSGAPKLVLPNAPPGYVSEPVLVMSLGLSAFLCSWPLNSYSTLRALAAVTSPSEPAWAPPSIPP